ncbi:hypothetical protein HDU98_001877 [Podochytrium sp. JEL0797]|nr:hypothetical protein HDU98_001877 [Podochytrium sp. JEL0797]
MFSTRRTHILILAGLVTTSLLCIRVLSNSRTLTSKLDVQDQIDMNTKDPYAAQRAICARYPPGAPILGTNATSPRFHNAKYPATVPQVKDSQGGGRIHVIGISDKKAIPTLMCESTFFSAALNDIPLEIYGAADYFVENTHNEGKHAKVDRILPILCAYDFEDSVLMVDAWDVIFQRTMEELSELWFRQWGAPNMVISTEQNCWPNNPAICEDSALPPLPPSSTKYLNSGVQMGRVSEYILFADLMKELHGGTENVQLVTAKMVYANHTEKGWLMDHRSELSASQQAPAPIFSEFEVDERKFMVSLTTKTVPMLIHLNGGGKQLINPRKKLWYFVDGKVNPKVKDQISSYQVFVDGKYSTVGELCPESFI